MKEYMQYVGSIVEFKKAALDWESFFEKGMKAKIESIIINKYDDYEIIFDFSDYFEYNKKFATPDFYNNETGNNDLFCWDTSHFPENMKESIYIFNDEDLKDNKYFKIIDKTKEALINEILLKISGKTVDELKAIVSILE